MYHFRLQRLICSFAVIIWLAACGGGGGGTSQAPDPGGSDPPDNNTPEVVSAGTITGFGSIFVNGVRYSTSGAGITTDERTSIAETALEVGMFVNVRGVMRDDGITADAHDIHYGDYVRGPVESIDADTNSLAVMGLHVFLDDLTVMDGIDYESLMPGHVVEISGAQNRNGELFASRLALMDTDTFKTHGTIEALDSSLMSFSINSMPVDYHLAETLPQATLANGMFVVVSGDFDEQGNLVAGLVRSRDERIRLGNGDRMTLAGVVDEIQSGSRFTVGGQVCLIDAETEFEDGASADDIGLNSRLRVEGIINEDSILIAQRISLHRNPNLAIRGPVEDIDRETGSITVNGVTFDSGRDIRFLDHGMRMRQFGFDDIDVGDPVEIRGFWDDQHYLAMMILRHENSDGKTLVDLMGEVSAINVTDSTFVLVNKTIRVSAATAFRIQRGPAVTVSEFFDSLEEGDVVHIIGFDQGDVVAAEEIVLRRGHHGMM